MKKNVFAKIALIAVAGFAVNAFAATATSTFNVKMTITSACNVSTAPGDINLGSAVASTTAVTNNGSTIFKVNCSKKTPFYVGLAPSAANGGTSAGTGFMKGALATPDLVPYTLYSNAALTTVWGNTATTTVVGNGMSGMGAGMAVANAVSFTAYAQAVNADFAPDSYTDVVTVNVNY